jgi:hypothetical protein
MQSEYDYSVINPVVDKSKLRELAYMIKGMPAPTIYKPTLYVRKINSNNNGNQNIYGNNVAAWRIQTLVASSSYERKPSLGEIVVRRRRENNFLNSILFITKGI